MIVPTVDTVRNSFVFSTCVGVKRNVLAVGDTGVGKTVQVSMLLDALPETHTSLVINFSATTRSDTTQGIVEGVMEKRSKDKFGPAGGKQLVLLIDDFNMPKISSFESPFQPPLELIRLWLDYGGWYDRQKCAWKYILDTQLVTAMAPPSGGRAVICNRTQARFHLVNCTQPSEAQICKIFESILTPKLQEFSADIKPMGKNIAQATLNVYNDVNIKFLPTPTKHHYQFNLRDVAKVVQGVLQAETKYFDTSDSMLRLWVHECQRVFSDRFVLDHTNDPTVFIEVLTAQLKATFEADWRSLMSEVDDDSYGPILCSFMEEGLEGVPYEEVTDFPKLEQRCSDKLEDYNLEPKLLSMDLVLFKDAIRHICRIHRSLRLPRGSMMLVGVGGVGRQSVCRLASYAVRRVAACALLFSLRPRIRRDDVVMRSGRSVSDETSLCSLLSLPLLPGRVRRVYDRDHQAVPHGRVARRHEAAFREGRRAQQTDNVPLQRHADQGRGLP